MQNYLFWKIFTEAFNLVMKKVDLVLKSCSFFQGSSLFREKCRKILLCGITYPAVSAKGMARYITISAYSSNFVK